MNDEGRHGHPLSAAAWQVAAEAVQEREREFRAKLAKALDVPDGGQYFNDFLTRIQALQERAEKAEAALRRIASMSPSASQAGWFIAVGIAKNALSPTQETDEPDCTRCGNERTVGGYGTDERFPCPVCRPDPIRCQSRCDQWPNCQHDWRSWHNRPTQETSEPDRILSAAGAVTEPERVLIAAGVEALRPFVRSLRKMGWAAGITAHSDPLKVTLDIDLTGLKRPAQETDPE